ncbi:MAG: phenylalanine--tRNA ligase subunit beta [Candidatus Paceibacterota bacterium]|jgi:phenylalanyl-tRNA synthetase beta chain
MKYSYNWLKWYIPDAPEAEKLAEILTYHLAEVESLEKILDKIASKGEDTILDIKILPNRAHDLLSHSGLARELAALLDIKFTDPTPNYKVPESGPTDLKIEIKTDKCRRYMGRVIRNVKVGPSPAWVVAHLEAIGERSINNLVDASNLVMFNCGQPTHVFDLKKVKEKIVVRQAEEGEELTTLDNRQCKFKKGDMLIADAERALAIAGVKGGKVGEVDDITTDVILEVANFDPTAVRKTAQSQNIFTEARKRFENDLSPTLGDFAMLELSALIAETCPEAKFEEIVDEYPAKPAERAMEFSGDKVRSVLGLQVSDEEIGNVLKRYRMEYTNTDGKFTLQVPPLRLDLALEEDMAEEIGRVLGYDKIKGSIPKVNFQPKPNDLYTKITWARSRLLSEGYSEVMTTSFKNKGKVSVLASASDKNYLRTDLTDGLKESIKLNQVNAPLLGLDNVKIFEIGTVWTPAEEMRVAYGDKKEIKEMTLEEYASQIEKNSAALPASGLRHGQNFSQSVPQKFTMWALYPFIARDVAVWVPESVPSEEVKKVIKENAGDMVVRGPELFDEFKKDGKISYAFRIVFQSYDRTLTDVEINDIMNKISAKIGEKDGWAVR